MLPVSVFRNSESASTTGKFSVVWVSPLGTASAISGSKNITRKKSGLSFISWNSEPACLKPSNQERLEKTDPVQIRSFDSTAESPGRGF